MELQKFPYIVQKAVGNISFSMEVGSPIEQTVVDGIYFEQELLEEMFGSIRPGDIIYDIGSSTGTHTIPLAIRTGDSGTVYSFEPDPECALTLRYNISLNHLKNVNVLETALWDRDSKVVIHTGGRAGPAPQVTERNQQARSDIEDLPQHYEIPSRSIESLVGSGDIRPPDILKIDVEGAGIHVLDGLGHIRPREIFIEVHPSIGESRDRVVELLSSLDYILVSDNIRMNEVHLHFKLSREVILIQHEYERKISEQLEQLLRELKVPNDAKILEVASEIGLLSPHLAKKGFKTTIIGSSDVIKKAREYHEKIGLQGNFQVLDIFKISKATVGKYDIIIIMEILDHYDGCEVVQLLGKMKDLADYIVILSQNPKCMPCWMYNRLAKEMDNSKSGLTIMRESLLHLAKLAGLETTRETFFSATSLSQWMADIVSPEIGELYADNMDQNLITHDQQHFTGLVGKARTGEIKLQEMIELYRNAFEREVTALRKAYYADIQALSKKISDREKELITQSNTIKQLELYQVKGSVLDTPIGLLLSLYYQRLDLQQVFPEVTNHDYGRLIKWAQDTVDGKTGDYTTEKLMKFADWFRRQKA